MATQEETDELAQLLLSTQEREASTSDVDTAQDHAASEQGPSPDSAAPG